MLGGATIKKCQLKVWKLRYLHYFSTSDVNMSIRRSEKHQGTQIYWFDLLLFNQNWINFEKPSKKSWFLSTFKVFQEFFNPGWKVADQTQKFVFLEVFRFFWHLYQQQVRRNSGWKESWAKIPVCIAWAETLNVSNVKIHSPHVLKPECIQYHCSLKIKIVFY